jgi:hypothetical protein
MSEYQQFLVERNKVDFLMQKGYRISDILENLNGSYVDFIHPDDQSKETLHISTANGRKYFSSILIKQNTTSYIKNE